MKLLLPELILASVSPAAPSLSSLIVVKRILAFFWFSITWKVKAPVLFHALIADFAALRRTGSLISM
jgi:hypothetical protein